MNQIAIRENNQLAPNESEFFVMKEQSQMLLKSGFLPQSIKTPEQAIAIILTGRELGIGTMQALNNITVIQGKPTISPQLMLALIQRSGQLDNIIIKNNQSPDGKNQQVAVTMKRKGHTEHTEIFGTNEAASLKLLTKDNYLKQPMTMFKWRAVAACARVVFPDVILGMYSPDEMGADTEVTDTEEIVTMPAEEKRSQVVVKMPPAKPVETQAIQAEPVFDEPKQDYTDEWNQAMANPTVQKEVYVSPETKGKLLAEGGYVSRSAQGFEVSDNALGEVFTVTKPGKVIICPCEDYTEGRKHNDTYRCAHIEAVKFYQMVNPLKQAA